MQITGVVGLLVGFSIILFEVFPEESVWSIPVRQTDEHVIAVPAPGGLTLLLGQKKEAYNTLTKGQQRFWKRILIVDDSMIFFWLILTCHICMDLNYVRRYLLSILMSEFV
jgi:hypothetical protein